MANQGHVISWFEVVGRDAEKLRSFYGALFEWTFDADNPQRYGLVDAEQTGIPGGVGVAQEGSGWTTFYVQVDDLTASIEKALASGGAQLMPPTDVDGARVAVIADPEGHPVGLAQNM